MASGFPSDNLSSEDLESLRRRGIDPERTLRHLEILRNPPPPLVIERPCRPGDGVLRIKSDERQRYISLWSEAATAGRLLKFVPASGAASRMFTFLRRTLLDDSAAKSRSELDRRATGGDPDAALALQLLEKLEELRTAGPDRQPAFLPQSIAPKRLEASDLIPLLGLERLQNGNAAEAIGLAKGLLPFHRYGGTTRTAFEEHLIEGYHYVAHHRSSGRFHFTVSPEHLQSFRTIVEHRLDRLEEQLGGRLEIGFSVQDAATDTVATELDDRPLRDGSGRILLRPGGHGALLSNLSRLDGDVVFIKNIDNVAPERLHPTTVEWKQILCGVLLELERDIHETAARLEAGESDERFVDRALAYLSSRLTFDCSRRLEGATLSERRRFLAERVHRPLRVCGVVANKGEPGGGPFWVRNEGESTGQIVESSQLDRTRPEQARLWKTSSHFNPVDIVCSLRDFRGHSFNLDRYVDQATYFISQKRHHGTEIKTLELPGLWNGAMANWNTLFVEVPIETFTPVKTLLDLVRPQHLP